ncbi:glycosyltransferase [Colwellia echini]|uniref:Glycosyltransferase n=1 Tax=Colwellia echini TaxID=1982103 RepID=A0ABY3MWZ3_9GAMM|nr:glycosyltransferase [Colwellia echini]TYK65592.1 glycosyltransferase [Colwellia echini]
MKFSIIIPAFNAQIYITKCIDSILIQRSDFYDLEVLIIDDCSTDDTFNQIEALSLKYTDIRVFTTESNEGPGGARNIGIKNATGDWIMFIDSDDQLHSSALQTLYEYIQRGQVKYDLVAYNFEYDNNSTVFSHNTSRNDFQSLRKNKDELILDYLSLYMDGSVIYTLISRELIEKNKLSFFGGYHEDIDFLFKAYLHCEYLGEVDKSLYLKLNHKNSIVNNTSIKHFTGIFRACKEMYNYLENNNSNNENRIIAYYVGIIGVCATRIRTLCNQEVDAPLSLYKQLYDEVYSALQLIPIKVKTPVLTTKYYMIYTFFKENIESNTLIEDLNYFVSDISGKSWSCYDLHHSLFLAPDEIRTCCKRFFVNNKMKGDVVLLDNKKDSIKKFSAQNILKAKKDLYVKINKGASEECGGCPFLEFKDWPSLNELDIQYLSFEYHSVCNMKCTYCSDTYYGGKKSSYEVDVLLDELVEDNALSNNAIVVYGGGEPTLGDNFTLLLNKVSQSSSTIKQRVITNSTKYNETIKRLIDIDKVSIITSIDAGTEETFYQVRKHKGFDTVFNNLVKYSEQKPENITIKYIILDENRDRLNISEFVRLIDERKLHDCNFQISFDFKKEVICFESLLSIVLLYGALTQLNVRLVFVDDLLRARLPYTIEMYRLLTNKLHELDCTYILADYSKFTDIVIWGAGIQTQKLLASSIFLKNTNIQYLVDNTASKIGNEFMGYKVYDPSILLENDYPILISATQATPQILNVFKQMKLNEDRIIKSFIL